VHWLFLPSVRGQQEDQPDEPRPEAEVQVD